MTTHAWAIVYISGAIFYVLSIIVHIGLIRHFQGYVMDGDLDTPILLVVLWFAWPIMIALLLCQIFYNAFLDYIDEMKTNIARDGSNYIGWF